MQHEKDTQLNMILERRYLQVCTVIQETKVKHSSAAAFPKTWAQVQVGI